jgi:hypothetical protein
VVGATRGGGGSCSRGASGSNSAPICIVVVVVRRCKRTLDGRSFALFEALALGLREEEGGGRAQEVVRGRICVHAKNYKDQIKQQAPTAVAASYLFI